MTAMGVKMKFRDVQAAKEVEKKAEFGWLDVEFSMYGCAYLDRKKDIMQYKVSARAEDIYLFLEQCGVYDIYPSFVEKMTLKCPVPVGMKTLIEKEVKKELARELRKLYPKELFVILDSYIIRNDSSAELLWRETDKLEGVFDEEKLNEFQSLVEYAYKYCILSKEEYDKLKIWLIDERKNMDDDINKELQGKNLYGLLYEDGIGIKTVVDARKENICKKIIEIEMRKGIVSPIYSKFYEYDKATPITAMSKSFRGELKDKELNHVFDKIKELRENKNMSKQVKYKEEIKNIELKYGEKAASVMEWYGYRWGIL